MYPLRARLARVGLAAAASYGFALAGGYALQAHGFLERISDDVDLFTDITDPTAFAGAVDRVTAAYRADGFTVDVEPLGEVFARFAVIDDTGRAAKVEMGCDWRSHPPVRLDIGPVLHPDDAVANKVTTLFGRAAPRDCLDVDAALNSGCYTPNRLLEPAEEHDPGFDRAYFALALQAVDRWPDREYAVYGVNEKQSTHMRDRLKKWAARITDA
ncbi:nucleotidyl transferase AbiEii/AbiGii toxin family protein [Embleya sp. NPDC050493]|uniref:nucleotidyl transferase AbiEii/AbiGii toxin family protein n=1 Tax=Embleya sp. NPDC050493 TaxID=3363989 RepID=UPI00378BF9D0